MAVTAGPLWRRAIQALAHAFDPVHPDRQEDTVFQTNKARSRDEARAARCEADKASARRNPQTMETLQ
jgi:uncharacterized protein YdeI (YjbR/CyaY-like superfamily)